MDGRLNQVQKSPSSRRRVTSLTPGASLGGVLALAVLGSWVFACGGAAWGHDDGFGDQVSDGCQTEEECEQLLGAAKWRVRRCGAANREAELCAEAESHLQAVEARVKALRARSASEQSAAAAAEQAAGADAHAEATASCESEQADLRKRLEAKTTEASDLRTEVNLLREQLKSAEAIAEALKGDQLKK